MKIRVLTGAAIALATTAGVAHADTFATSVELVQQGLQKGGNVVRPQRSNPLNALGAPEGVAANSFYALGFGGYIVLGFGGEFGSTITVSEATMGNVANHPETADIFVGWGASAATATYQLVSAMSNLASPSTFDLAATNDLTGRTTYSFVKIVDTTDINSPLLNTSADGFDVDGVSVGAVPAPGSVALLGAAGLLARRRRRA